MPAIKKVLFPTDFSELSNHALPYAIRMAKNYGAELIMVHAITLHEYDPNNPDQHFPALRNYCEEVEKAADNGFQVCIEHFGDHGVTVRKAVVQGVSPHAAILDYIKEEGDIGLIVMSTHGRSGLAHVLLGSVAENILRYSSCPVLVVKQPEHEFLDPKTGEVHLRKILFPFDFSEESIAPLDFLRSVAEVHGSEIIVFHSVDVEIPPVYYTSGIDSVLQLDPDLFDRVKGKMQDVVGEKLEGLDVRYSVAEGRAVDRIRELAKEEEVDLIVMGAAGSHGIGDFLFGSTTARVIQKAVCPVFVV